MKIVANDNKNELTYHVGDIVRLSMGLDDNENEYWYALVAEDSNSRQYFVGLDDSTIYIDVDSYHVFEVYNGNNVTLLLD